MTHLEGQGIVRQRDGEWWIFYARSEEALYGPFASVQHAAQHYYDLSAFDRMVVAQSPPGANTDREFLHGVCNGNQFERQPEIGNYYKRECEKRGGSVKGRKYLSQLAKFPGDPEAWISSRGDVQKVLEKRGWGSEGSVKVKARESDKEPAKAIPIADKIVDRETARELEGQTVTKREYLDRRDKVKRRLSPSRKK